MKERLVILVASGASIKAGVPSTMDLTKAVISMPFHVVRPNQFDIYYSLVQAEKIQSSFEKKEFISQIVFRALRNVFTNPNFEHVLAALEQLELMAGSLKDAHRANDYLHILSPFMYFRDEYAVLREPNILNSARREVIKLISGKICESLFFQDTAAAKPTREFIDRLKDKYRLSVFTLNYDDLLDLAGEDWFDGYEPINAEDPLSISAFNRETFLEHFDNRDNTLVHLHGSVRYGYSMERPFEIVKFANRNNALESLRSVGGNKVISGEDVTSFPIISGLNKLAKLGYSPFPYAYYYRAFVNTIISCNKLLIVGYGGSDEHLNSWLEQFVGIHGDDRRVCYLSWCDGTQIGERNDLNDLLKLLAGAGNFREYMAYYDKDEPSTKFQEHGSLALIPSGFPIDSKELDSTMEQILTFLG